MITIEELANGHVRVFQDGDLIYDYFIEDINDTQHTSHTLDGSLNQGPCCQNQIELSWRKQN
jgi:hypothetical protein